MIHAFTDDVLADHDAVGLASLIRSGEVSREEVLAATVARVQQVDPDLHAVQAPGWDRPINGSKEGPFAGVPMFVKDNTNVAGFATGHGTASFTPAVAQANSPMTDVLLSTGLVVIGKTRLPEFGFNASTEYMAEEACHNPWNLDYSTGASSGGSAALTAAGAVTLSHANDGGGSIRIPAACCGLVGLKPSARRLPSNEQSAALPIPIVADGVVTRSVRDTAVFLAAAEKFRPAADLPPIGLVEGPSGRKLTIGLVVDAPTGVVTDGPTREAVLETARVLEEAGHHVEPLTMNLYDGFDDDFILFYGMCALGTVLTGRKALGADFRTAKLDNFSRGFAAHARRRAYKIPGMIRRLKGSVQPYSDTMSQFDLVLSPVLAHTTPRLGHLSPNQTFDELITKLRAYATFTPLHNIVGAPGISLPLGTSPEGLPIGVHLSAAVGNERVLLEAGFELEAAMPFARISDRATAAAASPRTP